ncbi:MOXD1 2 protein [Blattella germanica]|nr:MOXD1 2 protein [Blattella germanica]
MDDGEATLQYTYEPLHQPGNRGYIHHVIMYECQGSEEEFEDHARDRGQVCYQPSMPKSFFNCNNVVIAWGVGSEGFSFPPEAGYPLDPEAGPKYFMMETHYSIPPQEADVSDSSGIRVYYTPTLRENDAGVLSVGLDPNWRHIIPPGQPDVVSEGHCISACTQHAIPPDGINMFAVALHTHLIATNLFFSVLQGDHLIAECVYNSVGRTTITLGGLTSREEMCLVFGGSSPVRIKSPPELEDMTLENRLVTYDWENNFRSFQEVTHKGSFKPLCWMKKPTLLPGTENAEAFYPNITNTYKEVRKCHNRWKKPRRRKKPGDSEGYEGEDNVVDDGESDDDDTKVYSSISLRESSRLNSSSRCIGLWELLVLSILLAFTR